MNIETLFPASQLSQSQFPISVKNLHLALGVQDRWDKWFWRRVKQYKTWLQDVDFIVSKNDHNDYEDLRVSVNMAKELGMIEKTPQGAAVRKYFLQCELIASEAIKKELESLKAAAHQPKLANKGKFAIVPVMQETLFGTTEPLRYELVPREKATPIDIARGKLHHNLKVQRGLMDSNESAQKIIDSTLEDIKESTKPMWELAPK